MANSVRITWEDLSSPDNRTPFWVFQRKAFSQRLQHYQQFGTVYYPVKANDCVPVIEAVLEFGGRFEVDSLNHLERLMELGVSPAKVQFSLPIRRESDTERAFQLGVRQYVVDSPGEVKRLSKAGRGLDLVVRLSIAEILDLDGIVEWKWGTTQASFAYLKRLIAEHNHKLAGLSFYLPAHVYSSESFERVIKSITKEAVSHDVSVIDIGGGLDTSGEPIFRKQLERIRKAFPKAHVIVEPGRNMLNPAFSLVTSVIGTAVRGRHQWAYLDAGIYNGLLDAALLGRQFNFSLLNGGKGSTDSPTHEYLLSGPTSDHLDFLGKHEFERPLVEGDRIIVTECGAYTYVLRTAFIGGTDMDLFEVT